MLLLYTINIIYLMSSTPKISFGMQNVVNLTKKAVDPS